MTGRSKVYEIKDMFRLHGPIGSRFYEADEIFWWNGVLPM